MEPNAMTILISSHTNRCYGCRRSLDSLVAVLVFLAETQVKIKSKQNNQADCWKIPSMDCCTKKFKEPAILLHFAIGINTNYLRGNSDWYQNQSTFGVVCKTN